MPTRDVAVFTLGRLPETPARTKLAENLAARLEAYLDGGEAPFGVAGRALGVHPNQLRYAAPTGRVLLRWDGANQPLVRTVPPPDDDPQTARCELARRYLHVFGPTTPEAFTNWAGIGNKLGASVFDGLDDSLVPVRTPIGHRFVLAQDEPLLRADPEAAAPARLLPSGDTFFLLHGDDRALLIEDEARRRDLWPSRVWPGAVLVRGGVVGTWRRAGATVTIYPWRKLSRSHRMAVAAEAASLPVPGVEGDITVRWEA